jgi:hypothetical protein
MVAAKFLDDFYYSNEFWAKVLPPLFLPGSIQDKSKRIWPRLLDFSACGKGTQRWGGVACIAKEANIYLLTWTYFGSEQIFSCRSGVCQMVN